VTDNVELKNKQINSIVEAAYALTNRIGVWTAGPETSADKDILNALALVQDEMKALFLACPDLNRPHNAEEVKNLVERALLLMTKCSMAFPNIDRVPELFRTELKKLYWTLNDASLIEAKEA